MNMYVCCRFQDISLFKKKTRKTESRESTFYMSKYWGAVGAKPKTHTYVNVHNSVSHNIPFLI